MLRPAVRLGSHLPTHVVLEPYLISLALCLQTAFRYRTEIALHLVPRWRARRPVRGAWRAPQAAPGLPSMFSLRKAAHWASERPVSRALHKYSRACQNALYAPGMQPVSSSCLNPPEPSAPLDSTCKPGSWETVGNGRPCSFMTRCGHTSARA